MQFGRWTVSNVVPKYKNEKTYCECVCCCEKHTVKMVYKYTLLKGESQSCGCLRKELTEQRCRIDRTGERFGNLVVKQMLYQYKKDDTYCLCDCDCGNEPVSESACSCGGDCDCGSNFYSGK